MRLNSDCTAYSLLWIARTPYIQHVSIFIWNRLCMCVCVLPRIEIESRYRSQFQSSFIRLYLYRSVSISFSFDAKQAALLPINNFLLVWIPNQMNLFRNIKKFLLIHSPACSLAHRLFHFRFSVVCEEFFLLKNELLRFSYAYMFYLSCPPSPTSMQSRWAWKKKSLRKIRI